MGRSTSRFLGNFSISPGTNDINMLRVIFFAFSIFSIKARLFQGDYYARKVTSQ